MLFVSVTASALEYISVCVYLLTLHAINVKYNTNLLTK